MKRCISVGNLKSMNNYAVETRRRSRSLLIVEGKHEKDELFWLIFKCFPELNIDIDDVWIYGTNIYKLYEDIVKEYGNDWTKDEMDVDLPFVISKKEHPETVCYRNDFTNIILVFDYERHDPAFSEEKISEMQRYFDDSTDMGKLYLNYPMIESYLHLKSIPDKEYIDRKISVSLQPGDKYKSLVKSESVIEKAVDFPHRIADLLAGDRYQVNDLEKREGCCEAILNLSANEIEKELEEILHVVGEKKKEKTLKYQLKDWIIKIGYTCENRTYWEYMRKVFQEIVCHNIHKAVRIQDEETNENDLRKQYEQIDLSEILDVQNEISRDVENGYIWVLSTCVLLIPDYNFKLVEQE